MIISRVDDESYIQWIEEFVEAVLDETNLKYDVCEIDDIEYGKRIFLIIDGDEYDIRTWNFHTIDKDKDGKPCSENVTYTLFKMIDDHGEEISEGNMIINWMNK